MEPERVLLETRKALAPAFLDNLQECVDCGLLPLSALNQFVMFKFLVHVVPAAQNAQRAYGIPASVLIAIAALESAFGTSDLARTPVGGSREAVYFPLSSISKSTKAFSTSGGILTTFPTRPPGGGR